MTKRIKPSRVALAIALALTTGYGLAAHATVLTFDGLTFLERIPQTYGDRIGAANTGGFIYGEGHGFTPNIVVEYAPSVGNFDLWEGYGDLVGALGHDSFNVLGEVRLIPDPGTVVTLHSFDLGAFSGDYPDSRVKILDGADNVLFDSGLFTALFEPNGTGTGIGHYSFPGLALSSNSALRIQVIEYGDLGLDNISFSASPVPLPAALPLLAGALLGVATYRRKST